MGSSNQAGTQPPLKCSQLLHVHCTLYVSSEHVCRHCITLYASYRIIMFTNIYNKPIVLHTCKAYCLKVTSKTSTQRAECPHPKQLTSDMLLYTQTEVATLYKHKKQLFSRFIVQRCPVPLSGIETVADWHYMYFNAKKCWILCHVEFVVDLFYVYPRPFSSFFRVRSLSLFSVCLTRSLVRSLTGPVMRECTAEVCFMADFVVSIGR